MSPSRPVRGGTKDGEAAAQCHGKTRGRPRRRLPPVRLRETRPEPPLLSTPLCSPAHACLSHFVGLIKDQSINQQLRVTPKRGKNKCGGHLFGLGPDGFFLCTCLELLIKGLPCRHSTVALLDTQIAFNGACVAPRWRTNATDWTIESIASKPARLAGTSAGSSASQQQIALGSSVFTPSISNVRSANYAKCCAFG